MGSNSSDPRAVRFGVFEVDFAAAELRKRGRRVKLEAQPFQVLSALVRRPGELVSREELRKELWPEDTFVEFDHSLNTAVKKIRQALDDSPRNPRYIETAPRQGYRFIAPVDGTRVRTSEAPERAEHPRRNGWLGGPRAVALVAGLAAAVFLYLPHSRNAPLERHYWTIRPMTSYTGHEAHASFSPDGAFAAFSHTARGNFDIYVRSVDGGRPLALTNHPADETLPRWSPDGRNIVFLSDRGQGAHLYLVSPLGGDADRLTATNLSRDQVVIHGLGSQPWSPDGRELLFTRYSANEGIAIWKINLTTREETQMTFPPPDSEDWDASWSFDGERAVFQRRTRGKSDLRLMLARGGEPELLVEAGEWPCWSLDGERIIFSSNRSGAINIWDIHIASGELRQLTFGPSRDGHAVVAANGLLAYDHFQNEGSLYRMDVESGKGKQLTFQVGGNFSARFSPDARMIVYQSNRTGNNEIWLFDTEQQSERRLTKNSAEDTHPDWSPDGRQIVFRSNRDEALHLWLMDSMGRSVRRLTEQSIPAPSPAMTANVTGMPWTLAPRWSPDGESIGYLAAGEVGTRLWVVDPVTGQAEAIFLSGQPLSFDWYRDSRHVVYVASGQDELDEREIRVANLGTGEESVLYRGPATELAAAPDGSGLTFCKSESLFDQKLYFLRLAPGAEAISSRAQGDASLLTDGEGLWHVHNGGLSPDGKVAVYTRETVHSDIFIIENYP